MAHVLSSDGTSIGYCRVGSGDLIVLVGGAFCDARSFEDLSSELAGEFSVVTYDRRGRGASGDTAPYSVRKEVEDLAAILDEHGPASVYGHSSGGILALEGAMAGLPIRRLAVYEPPYVGAPGPPFAATVTELVGRGESEAAAKAWLLGCDVPPAVVDGITHSPAWEGMVDLAPTLLYDLALTGDGCVPHGRLSQIGCPVLVARGEFTSEELRDGCVALAQGIEGALSVVCEGQGHGVDAMVIAPELAGFCRAT